MVSAAPADAGGAGDHRREPERISGVRELPDRVAQAMASYERAASEESPRIYDAAVALAYEINVALTAMRGVGRSEMREACRSVAAGYLIGGTVPSATGKAIADEIDKLVLP